MTWMLMVVVTARAQEADPTAGSVAARSELRLSSRLEVAPSEDNDLVRVPTLEVGFSHVAPGADQGWLFTWSQPLVARRRMVPLLGVEDTRFWDQLGELRVGATHRIGRKAVTLQTDFTIDAGYTVAYTSNLLAIGLGLRRRGVPGTLRVVGAVGGILGVPLATDPRLDVSVRYDRRDFGVRAGLSFTSELYYTRSPLDLLQPDVGVSVRF